ncbi:MAG: NADP-dependent phosphogluconate dehydrogenase [Candidatus Atribacteria bacterium]|nr:NADP-dependent phosphogluconate dehydrogenase [Candidatus Atribacteria bacterium]
MPEKNDLALIGLAVMGQNLALNIARHGYSLVVFNRTPSKTHDLLARKSPNDKIFPAYDLSELVGSLKKPRKILLMVKAGQPVDEFLLQLYPLLEKGDVIIDGGNSHFLDTERRAQEAEKAGFYYLGTGISGGEEGALHGPSIMPGGHRTGYEFVQEIFLKAAAQTEDGPCCFYLGPGGAGHFVKMVHNGIEYALMELIAEAYDLMRKLLKMDPPAIAEVFKQWNQHENLNSFLLEISIKVLNYRDPETNFYLVDLIDDRAEQKGTGKWTSQVALDFGVPIPTINQAVVARILSARKANRVKLAAKIRSKNSLPFSERESQQFLTALADGLYLASLMAFNEGIQMLFVASQEKNWNLPLVDIARIWKGGCILRTRLLNRIQLALKNSALEMLIESPEFIHDLQKKLSSLCHVVKIGMENHIPLPSFQGALSSLESWSSSSLPTNLIQAQRDFFGAHTYRRIDREGIFHTQWEGEWL